jgi:hypothetical protein
VRSEAGDRMTADSPDEDDAARPADRGEGRHAGPDDERRHAAPEARGRGECYDAMRVQDRPGACRGEGPGPDRARAAADGGWRWKGLELSPAANRIADQELAGRRAAEGRDAEGGYGEAGLTPAMRRIEAKLEHGTLVPDTERFALKSPDRFKEKLAKMISLEPDSAPGDLARRIHDGIRYTLLFESRHYSDGVREAESRLADEGCSLVWRKPNWTGEEYKGINSQWRDASSGQLFEVQFHTPESWNAKQQTHGAYEKIENPSMTLEERERLRAYQREVAASVKVPPGALEFAPYIAKVGCQCRKI